MEQYLPVMSEEYKRKHYGEGIFNRIHKNTAKISWGIYIFFGAVLAGCVYGMMWCMKNTEKYRLTGEEDMIMIGNVFTGVFAVFALIALACIIISIIRHKRGAEKLKEHIAKKNFYTVEDMNRFEHQALEEESRVISLLGTFNKTMSGQEDGVLTRDYIYLRLEGEAFLKIADIRAAVLIHQEIKAGSMKNGKVGIDYLMIGLIGKNGVSATAECTREAGQALIDYLKEKCPDLYTADGEVLENSDYQDLWGEINKKQA